MSYQLVTHWQSKVSVTQLCATRIHLQATFIATGKCYGSRQLVAALRAKDIHLGRHKARRIIGWAMAPTMPAELVCRALRMAIALRQPAPDVIMHSDRGSQYASGEY